MALSATTIVRRLEDALGHIPEGLRPESEGRERAQIVLSHVTWIKAAALVADDGGRYILVNHEAARLTGYSQDELLRLSVWDLTPTPNGREGRRLWSAFLKAGRQAGKYPLRRKNGRVVPAQYVAVANVLPGIHISLLTRNTRRARRGTLKPSR